MTIIFNYADIMEDPFLMFNIHGLPYERLDDDINCHDLPKGAFSANLYSIESLVSDTFLFFIHGGLGTRS